MAKIRGGYLLIQSIRLYGSQLSRATYLVSRNFFKCAIARDVVSVHKSHLLFLSIMRYLGIDYGTKRVGIALSDEAGSFAFPHATLHVDDALIEAIVQIVRRERVGAIVLGDSLALSGARNAMTDTVEQFARELEERIVLPVHLTREAWSSQEAARFAPKGKKHEDSSAAAIILQRYLDQTTRVQ